MYKDCLEKCRRDRPWLRETKATNMRRTVRHRFIAPTFFAQLKNLIPLILHDSAQTGVKRVNLVV
jgi:hypothetical protein